MCWPVADVFLEDRTDQGVLADIRIKMAQEAGELFVPADAFIKSFFIIVPVPLS